jgi:hypothetical protein
VPSSRALLADDSCTLVCPELATVDESNRIADVVRDQFIYPSRHPQSKVRFKFVAVTVSLIVANNRVSRLIWLVLMSTGHAVSAPGDVLLHNKRLTEQKIAGIRIRN